jgi:hypothetical protein
MRWKNVGVLSVLVIGAMLTSNVGALAESLWWTGATQATDGTSFTSAEMATMTYYVRIDKPNPRDNTSTGGWYYLGETRNGASSYPADNSLASLMRSYGFVGQTVKFTVSQAFKGADGVERDSAFSDPLSWVVPVPPPPPVVPVTPGKPTGCLIK